MSIENTKIENLESELEYLECELENELENAQDTNDKAMIRVLESKIDKILNILARAEREAKKPSEPEITNEIVEIIDNPAHSLDVTVDELTGVDDEKINWL